MTKTTRSQLTLMGPLIIAVLLTVASTAYSQTNELTYSRDIAPILQQRCQTCHRPGEMGPMSLQTYEEVRPWAPVIKSKVVERVMPPWHLDKTVGIQDFENDISLTDAEIEIIANWVDAGAPQGNPEDLPTPIVWPSDGSWSMAKHYGREPDLIIKSDPWTQSASGQDQWWAPIVETGLTEDRWIAGMEVRPTLEGGRRVTHHALAYLQQDEEPGDFVAAVDVPGRGSYLTEFSVGKIGDVFRENTGKLMKAGSQIAFDNHYHSVGEEITAQTELGIWFYPQGYVPKYRVYSIPLGVQQAMTTLDIPPGKVTTHHAYIPLIAQARIENYQPHMHIRGKAMSMEAILPNGEVRMLSYVDHFDFNWHVNYVYTDESAPVLPAGTVLHLTAWHDNSEANRANPDPTQWVGWGQRSFDEMYHAHVNMTYLTDEDYAQIIAERGARK
ncbi:MAG: cytochrome c [Gammaproteobacteria bacterium]|nr:cytochrome c [Gammaproteobacteria bacterium]